MARRRPIRRTRRSRNFFERNWKTFLIAAVAVMLIVVIIKFVVPIANNIFSNNNQAGQLGIVKLDSQKIGVFDTKQEAENNATTIDAGISNIEISGSGELDASASVNGFPVFSLLTKQRKGTYTLDTTALGDGTTIIVKVSVGGDGSIIGQRLGSDVDIYYLAVCVSNPITPDSADTVNMTPISPQAQTAQAIGLPNGTVYIDGTSFETYGSEWDAQAAVSGKQNTYTLPRSMVANGLPIRVVPNTDNTERVFIQVTMVDNVDQGDLSVCANPQTNWEATLDVSQFAGHQITLMLKAEDGWALNNGYSYISFFLPQLEVSEEVYTISY